MAGNGCPCALAPQMPQVAELPSEYQKGETRHVWETKTCTQGTTEYSEAVLVPPCNGIAVELTVIFADTAYVGSGGIETSLDGGQNWTSAGTFNVNGPGTTFALISAVSGMLARLVIAWQQGSAVLCCYFHIPCR